jgi:urease accessory protein
MAPLTAMLLADGRFPGGGHAHSGGLEAAVADGSVTGLGNFQAFLTGRLLTIGAVDAWLAAAASLGVDPRLLDVEADARCPSPALRAASRRLGRGLRRAAARAFPEVARSPAEHHAVLIGAVAAAAGLGPEEAARWAVHGMLAGAASALVRLLPVDAADAMAAALALAGLGEEVAVTAVAQARGPVADGPACSAPRLEQRAEDHARWEVRLFAS